MGLPKKKALKAAPLSSKKARALKLAAQMGRTCDMLNETLDQFVDQFSQVTEAHAGGKTRKIPQALLKSAFLLQEILSTAKTTSDSFKVVALAHAADGGKFEGGEVEPVINKTVRRTPKWKDVACEEAEARADAKGETFHEGMYVKGQRDACTPTTSRSFKLAIKD